MKIQNHRKNGRAHRMALASALLALGAFAVVGCTGTDRVPTASPPATESFTPPATPPLGTNPTVTTAPAPKTEDEAAAGAEDKAHEYYSALTAREQGASPDVLKFVAVPPILDELLAAARVFDENGFVATGETTFSVTDSFATSYTRDTFIEHGLVRLTGCVDSSARIVTSSGGEPVSEETLPRSVSTILLTYLPDSQAWFVRGVEDFKEPC
jgi:hypothetical protein